MSEQTLSDADLYAFHEAACNPDLEEARSMAKELLHLRAVVANAVALINSGRCGLGHDVLITGKLNNE